MKNRILFTALALLTLTLNVSGQEFLRKNLANSALERLAAQQTQPGAAALQSSMAAGQLSQAQPGLQPLLREIRALRDSLRGAGDSLTALDLPYLRRKVFTDTLIYGSELFQVSDVNFAPNLQIATPADYVLGPGDKVQVSVFGGQSMDATQTVSRSGRITLEYGGVISVSGLTVEAAKRRISARLAANGFASLRNGQSQLDVTVAEVRSVQVSVLGARQPGTYTLPAVATTYHALYQAGGPTNLGSYRDIRVIRNGEQVATIDLYQFLTHGDPQGDIILKDGDIIHIPTYHARVNFTGKFKRNGLFEVLPGESLESAMAHAGGFGNAAYRQKVSLMRTGGQEMEMLTVAEGDFVQTPLTGGDVIVAAPILDRYANRVVIAGAVWRPGYFGWKEGLTAAEVVAMADGIRPDGMVEGVVLYRHLPTGAKFYISDALGQKVTVAPNDSLFIASALDFARADLVVIAGAVNNPQSLPYGEGMTVKDALVLGGGFAEGANRFKAEIATPIEENGVRTGKSNIFTIDIPNMNHPSLNTPLAPGSVVSVPFDPIQEPAGHVLVTGAARAPGAYGLASRTDHLSQIMRRAGGVAEYGDARFALIIRQTDAFSEQARRHKQSRIDSTLYGGLYDRTVDRYDTIAVNLNASDQTDKLVLRDGDRIHIPEFNPYVHVSGAVLNPTSVASHRIRRASYYVRAAGGANNNGLKRKTYVVYPNGKAAATRSYMMGLYNVSPMVYPGSTVVVPSADMLDRDGWDVGEWSALTGILTSLSTVSLTIMTFLQ